MSDKYHNIDQHTLEQESTATAPLVRAALADLAGLPSSATMLRIRAAAQAQLVRQRRHRIIRWVSLGAAALIAISLTSSTLLYQNQVRATRLADVNALISLTASEDELNAEMHTQELANRLLALQGLSEESFFNFEDEESLWL